ncbi:MAG: OmpA family protein [Bacteroidia bacterium]|nr:OmpA family protein [Bacteroidia bacterium]
MNTKSYYFILLFSGLFFIESLAQSNFAKIEAADKFYNQRDYANAALYYSKVINDTNVNQSRVLPYKIQMVNLSILPKEEKKKNQTVKNDSTSNTGKDSLAASQRVTPVKQAPIANDSTKKSSASATTVDPKKVSKYDYVLYRLGLSHLYNNDYNNASLYLKKCVERNIYTDANYFYALSLMNNKKYQEALGAFEAFVSSPNSNDSLVKIARKKEAGCYLGMDSAKVSREIKVSKLDTSVFNNGNSSFAPTFYSASNKIIFTSARKGNIVMDPKRQDGSYLCDLYYTEKTDTSWSPAVNFRGPVNTDAHEGAAFYSEDGSIYYTRWNDVNPKEAFIYKSKSNGTMFFQGMKLADNINMPGYRTMQPCLSPDGKLLYFSSNRPGGMGGYDIWVSTIDENGVTGAPKNLGAPFNTSGDEVTPFIHAISGTLYFSSNGLAGLGGLDIFKCDFNSTDGLFGFPQNLNAPFNSSKDDAYFVLDRISGTGFFASDREDCPGGNCYKIFEFMNKPIKFSLEGIVFDAQTNEPLKEALVSIIDAHGVDEPIYVATDDQGNYSVELKPKMEYFLKAQKNKYFGDAGSLNTLDKTTSQVFQQDFFLNKIPAGEIAIDGIEYDFNSAKLRPKGMENLDKLVDLLNLNDNLKVSIEANTDSRGSDAYNLKLSIARAQSCVDYVISKGIKAERLVSKGWGETNPLVTEAEINKMKPKSEEWEAAHQKNRRTALKVLGESEIKIINSSK